MNEALKKLRKVAQGRLCVSDEQWHSELQIAVDNVVSAAEGLYRIVDIVDGNTSEPVNYVGVHPLKWGKTLEPTAGFVEVEV